jgi:hypothetical protein
MASLKAFVKIVALREYTTNRVRIQLKYPIILT